MSGTAVVGIVVYLIVAGFFCGLIFAESVSPSGRWLALAGIAWPVLLLAWLVDLAWSARPRKYPAQRLARLLDAFDKKGRVLTVRNLLVSRPYIRPADPRSTEGRGPVNINMQDMYPGRCRNWRDGERCLDYDDVPHVCTFRKPVPLPDFGDRSYLQSSVQPKPWVKPRR